MADVSVQASTFVMFPDVHSACSAASVLRDQTAVDAVELFDTASLRCTFIAAPLMLMLHALSSSLPG